MQTGTCNAGCASDGGGAIPPPEIPDTSAGVIQKTMKPTEKTPVEPDKLLEKPIIPEDEKIAEKPPEKTEVEAAEEEAKPVEEVVQPERVEKPAEKKDFLSSFMGMFDALLKTILLILFIAGGILLYKKLRQLIPGKPAETGERLREPRTVSEAVSSYLSHKIKKRA